MKFRIIASLLVLAAVAAAWFLVHENDNTVESNSTTSDGIRLNN